MNHLSFVLSIFCVNFMVLPIHSTHKMQPYNENVVVAIFRLLKPVIEQHKDELYKTNNIDAKQLEALFDEKNSSSAFSLQTLNDIAQTVFLRPAGTERKDIVGHDNPFASYATPELWQQFVALGDVGSIYPKNHAYDYLVILGSTVRNMRERLWTLASLVQEERITISNQTKVIFLTGERDLFIEETEEKLRDPKPFLLDPLWKPWQQLPKTEDQAAEWIWHQLLLPASLRQASITFVRAPKNKQINAQTNAVSFTRPTTFDTVKVWLDHHKPAPGSCLIISSQPHVYYQDRVVHLFFTKAGFIDRGFTIECVGFDKYKADTMPTSFAEQLPVYLDNMARTLFNKVKLIEQID